MTRSTVAPAKINLALVVGPLRSGEKHEVTTVLQSIDLVDDLLLEQAADLRVTGFAEDTLVTRALNDLAAAAGVEPRWHVHIEKRIPVAAGLGGGSSDAAAALRLANGMLPEPLSPAALSRLAARLGADVPFFLERGTQLGTGDGTQLEPLELPLDYHVLLLLPTGAEKPSTAAVYDAFDGRNGAEGYEARRQELLAAVAARDLARLPRNDLASSPLAKELERRGAVRADVSGAGPCLYGLFETEAEARTAAQELDRLGAVWVCSPSRGTFDAP
jgi:4-diphosphocytidyl-2-C-methyl-D-erythritol kinase